MLRYPALKWSGRAAQEALRRATTKTGTVSADGSGGVGICMGDCAIPGNQLQLYLLMLMYFTEMFVVFNVGSVNHTLSHYNQDGTPSGFEMCFSPSTFGAGGGGTRLESSIKKVQPPFN